MTAADGVLTAYLERLDRATADLPGERREELLAGIREHLAAAQATGVASDEASALTVLDRLGSPEEIARAAREDLAPLPAAGWRDPAAGTDGLRGFGSGQRPGAAYGLGSGGSEGGVQGDPAWDAVPPAPVPHPGGTGLELAAVLLLTAGSLVPVVGWLAGVVLLWTSPRWRVREKVLGTLVVPLGPGAALWGGALLSFGRSETCVGAPVPTPLPLDPAPPGPSGEPGSLRDLGAQGMTCTTSGPPGWVAPLVLAVVLVAPVVVAVFLLRRARRRAAAEPPVLLPASSAGRGPWGPLEVGGVLVLALGGFLAPVVGPVVGLVLVCCSSQWRTWQKVVAAALTALPLLTLVLPVLIMRSTL